MVLPDYAGDLKRYVYASAIKEWFDKQPNRYMEDPLDFLDWKEMRGDYDSPSRYLGSILDSAFSTIRAAMRRYRATYEVSRGAERILDLIDRSKPKTATAVLQIEASESAA